MSGPPRWASRLLRMFLPPGPGGSILGDLHQEYLRLAPRSLRLPWYLAAGGLLVLRYLPSWIHARAASLHGSVRDLGARGVGADARHAMRSFRSRPAFPAIAVATLGLGIGATTAIFSLVDVALLRPLPYERPGELYTVFNTYPAWRGHDVLDRFWDRIPLSYPEYRRWRDGQSRFADVGIYAVGPLAVTGRGDPATLMVGRASSSLFPLLGVQPALGRAFRPEEEGARAPAVVLLGHRIWQARFGGRGDALGATLSLGGVPFTVIGILPPRFEFRNVLEGERGGTPDLWIPVGADGAPMDDEGHHTYPGIARLAESEGLASAEEESAAILRGEQEATQRGARVAPRAEEERGGTGAPLLLLLASVSALMLVGCTNVATVMLGEVSRRQQELATRAALGAGRARLVRQLLVESSMLGLAGAAIGLLVARVGVDVLLRFAPSQLALPETVGLDLRVLLFASGMGIATGLGFGLLPALAAGRADLQTALRRGAAAARPVGWRSQQMLIVAEVAMALVLLICGGLLGRSLVAMFQVDPGFSARDVATVQMAIPAAVRDDGRGARFVQRIAGEIGAIPGVRTVGGSSGLPFAGRTHASSFEIEGRDLDSFEEQPQAHRQMILPGFHELLRIPLLEGRTIDERDVDGAPRVVVISESMARRYWPRESPLGRRIVRDDRAWEIVGVVGDVLHTNLDGERKPTFYFPFAQEAAGEVTFLVQGELDPGALLVPIRKAVWTVDPALPIEEVGTLRGFIAGSAAEQRYRTLLLALFGTSALLLAGLGIFGVTARAVARRRREFGIRIALGAGGRSIVRLIVRQEAVALGLGIVLGLAVAAAAGRLLSRFLFGVTTDDPLTYAVATLVLAAFGLVAMILPARRATRVDPGRVLQAE